MLRKRPAEFFRPGRFRNKMDRSECAAGIIAKMSALSYGLHRAGNGNWGFGSYGSVSALRTCGFVCRFSSLFGGDQFQKLP